MPTVFRKRAEKSKELSVMAYLKQGIIEVKTVMTYLAHALVITETNVRINSNSDYLECGERKLVQGSGGVAGDMRQSE